MPGRQRFELVYAPEVRLHLRAIEPHYHSLIRTVLESELAFRPQVETRNCKPLRRPVTAGADWELRLGPGNRFRVFYEVDAESRTVSVLAVGVKDGNRLWIGGEEVGP
ncbi:MAG: addiction module toxin RelE [Armatimonadetes bacterium]|nr:addiction module toxin RelE [Armatimonadota bacterium]